MSAYPPIASAIATVAVDGGEAFHRPLRFGDPGQVDVMRAINSDDLFCCVCFETCDVTGLAWKDLLGRPCRVADCPGYYVTGNYWESVRERAQRKRERA